MPKMLILRGNRGNFPDEFGKPHDYATGTLHEDAAKKYAMLRGYDGFVLPVSGDPPAQPKADTLSAKKPEKLTRAQSPQTLLAIKTIKDDSAIAALYGFSGGGYNVWWIIRRLEPAELQRMKLIVVLGAPDRPRAEFEASNFSDKGANWELVYKTNPPRSDPVIPKVQSAPKGLDPHAFGPDALLRETLDKI